MRISTQLRLIALCLVAGSLSASASARPPAPEPKKPIVEEEFTGYGKTVTAAEKDALRIACEWLAEKSNVGWPALDDLRDEQKRENVAAFLRARNMVSFSEPVDQQFEEPSGTMKVVKMKLEITAAQGRELQKQVQQARMKSRQGISLLVVIGVVCVLAVVGGYLRLEEATKGYYTRLLRVTAISVLILVVLGLCVAA